MRLKILSKQIQLAIIKCKDAGSSNDDDHDEKEEKSDEYQLSLNHQSYPHTQSPGQFQF